MMEEEQCLCNESGKYIIITYDPDKNMIYSRRRNNLADKNPHDYVHDKDSISRTPVTIQYVMKDRLLSRTYSSIQYFVMDKDELNEMEDGDQLKVEMEAGFVFTLKRKRDTFRAVVFRNGKYKLHTDSTISAAAGFIFLCYGTETAKVIGKNSAFVTYLTGFNFNYVS